MEKHEICKTISMGVPLFVCSASCFPIVSPHLQVPPLHLEIPELGFQNTEKTWAARTPQKSLVFLTVENGDLLP